MPASPTHSSSRTRSHESVTLHRSAEQHIERGPHLDFHGICIIGGPSVGRPGSCGPGLQPSTSGPGDLVLPWPPSRRVSPCGLGHPGDVPLSQGLGESLPQDSSPGLNSLPSGVHGRAALVSPGPLGAAGHAVSGPPASACQTCTSATAPGDA